MPEINDIKSGVILKAKLLRIKDLTSALGLSRSHIYKLSKEGKFPKPIPIVEGGVAVGWLAEEIQDWLDERIAARKDV